MNRGRIGEIVGWNINGLDRGYGAAHGVSDALLQRRKLRTHRRLIAKPRGHLSHEPRHLGAGLYESEDIIDEQEYITMVVVSKVFGHCQRTMANTEAAAWRLVHFAEPHYHFRQQTGIFHFTVQLFALTAALTDPTEDTHAVVMPDHVVNHLGQQYSLADPSAAE